MRVAMLNLTFGGLSGGYKKYLHRVVPQLRNDGSISELLNVLPPGYERLIGGDPPAWSWNPGEPWRGYPALAARVREWKPDVVFIPTARYVDCGAPTLGMVQNMLPMLPPTFRDGLADWAKLRLDSYLARRATRLATRVIAVSGYVRDFLADEWQVRRHLMGVVYHGVDPVTAVSAPDESVARQITGDFVFAAGSLFTYRGLEDVIRALPLLQSQTLRLLIAGQGSASYQSAMQELAGSLGVAQRVTWLGQVDPATMAYAYQQCRAFVMSSRVEACPNIALEAMASGARCISTTCPPMPEFFDDAALYYSAGDAPGLATHIDSTMQLSAVERDGIRSRGAQRALEFTWEDTARGVVRELQLTLNQGR